LSFSDGAEQKAIRAADHLSTTFRQSTWWAHKTNLLSVFSGLGTH
jgi:hypothetical protein